MDSEFCRRRRKMTALRSESYHALVPNILVMIGSNGTWRRRSGRGCHRVPARAEGRRRVKRLILFDPVARREIGLHLRDRELLPALGLSEQREALSRAEGRGLAV